MTSGTLNPDSDDLKITAGWGHDGKEGVTMPGKGKAPARSYAPDERAALGDAADALGPDTRDVYLNGVALWRNVPARVWDYTLGAYQVLKKWLSYREHALRGRDLTPAEAEHVTARRLAASPPRRLAACRLPPARTGPGRQLSGRQGGGPCVGASGKSGP